MKKASLCVLATVAMSMLAAGCVSRGIKEGLGVALGAKGIYAETKPVAPGEQRTLSDYGRIRLGALNDTTGGQLPGDFSSLLPGAFSRAMADKKLPTGSGAKTLEVRATIIYYESAGMMGQAFGPFEEVVARVALVDTDTGKELGVANCVGRTNATTTQGVAKKAEGLGKAIAEWIANRSPKIEE